MHELDYIGQLENMKEVEEKLSQILNAEIKFDWIKTGNKGPSRDYCSIKIDPNRFNQIFAEDYQTLKDFYSPLKE